MRNPAPLIAAAALWAACTPPPKGDRALPFEELTIQNVVKWPDGREYVTTTGQGYPAEGDKAQESRRRVARDAALVAAQEKMIVELKRDAPREKIRDLLRQAEVAKVEYAYDDICTLTLRIPRELLTPKETKWE